MKKVLIPTKLNTVAANTLKEDGNYEVIQDESSDLDALAEEYPDTYALIVRSEKVPAGIIDRFPGLKVIIRAGSGYDNIDTRYARQKKIDVMNTPGANSNAVAEEVVALMLADARHVIEADLSTRSGKWEKKKYMGREISGKTVGIVGLGHIGRLVARRLSGFDVELLGYDPLLSADRARGINVTLTDLDSVFSRCDYITLHLPENDETKGMINETLVSKMKEGATLINCARAGIIDEGGIRRLKCKKQLRFLNDVYPKDAAGEKTVADIADIMMPHLGASTVEANYNAARNAAKQLIDFDYRGVTSFIVNRDIPQGLDEAYCELANTLARLCRKFVGTKTTLKLIETSFYGDLEPFSDWLLIAVMAGLSEEVDMSMDFPEVREYLADMGIEYVNRRVDPLKKYGDSITVDLTAAVDPENLRRSSIRGTVAEDTKMVSRIDGFRKLYFEPSGPTAFFVYDDRPGVIGKIGSAFASAGLNINGMLDSRDEKTQKSLAIMKLNELAPGKLVNELASDIRSSTAFCVKL
ncbi:MAG: NAD(P)-dependent oxidoreductase [Kiritimatiellia bacterium]